MTIELRGITWGHERGLDPLTATAERWAREQDVRVVWEARSLQGFADASIPELAQRYDLLVYDHPHVGEIVPTGALLPFDELLDADFIADQAANSVGPSHRSYEWDGHLWGLAIDAAGHTAAYRADLLERIGAAVPETWDDVFALADAAKGHGMSVTLPLQAVDTLAAWLTLAANAGTDPYADPERILPREVGMRHLETIERLTALSPAGAWHWNPIRVLEQMATTDEVVYCPILFNYSNYSRPGFREHLVRLRPIPSAGLGPRGGVIGGAGIGISAHTREREAAAAYAAWVASPAIQRTLYVEAGGQPGHRSAWLDEHANELATGFFRDTLPGLDAGYLRPRYDGQTIVQNEGGDIFCAHLRDRGDRTALLDTLDALYRRSLEGVSHG
jgi:multiple sugar transport system substrate-binding protein